MDRRESIELDRELESSWPCSMFRQLAKVITSSSNGSPFTRLLSTSHYCQAKSKDAKDKSKLGINPNKTLTDGTEKPEEQMEVLADISSSGYQLYPDENTANMLFNGLKYKDLPYVSIRCRSNHTRFWVNKADGKVLFYTSPKMNGFLNAKKRTAVAAQATGHVVGQKLRMLNMRTIRLRIDGYNAGRLSSVKGLVQSGTKIVSISDITTIDWGWCQRAKKRKRKN